MTFISITEDMQRQARQFAEEKVGTGTAFPRLGESREAQIERWSAGKLGEFIGQEALKQLGIPHHCPDKLKVVADQYYRDRQDAIIYPDDADNRRTVDFKTAWKPFHIRLLVPEDMFRTQPKDVYIGIRVDLEQGMGQMYGYITREELAQAHDIKNFGEGPAYWEFLDRLHPLDDLKEG